jgi:hypothetical protein
MCIVYYRWIDNVKCEWRLELRAFVDFVERCCALNETRQPLTVYIVRAHYVRQNTF